MTHTVVNTETVMATARGIDVSHDANLLAENDGHIDISKSWATHFGKVAHVKGTTSEDLIINWEQTGLNVCTGLLLDICRKGVQAS